MQHRLLENSKQVYCPPQQPLLSVFRVEASNHQQHSNMDCASHDQGNKRRRPTCVLHGIDAPLLRCKQLVHERVHLGGCIRWQLLNKSRQGEQHAEAARGLQNNAFRAVNEPKKKSVRAAANERTRRLYSDSTRYSCLPTQLCLSNSLHDAYMYTHLAPTLHAPAILTQWYIHAPSPTKRKSTDRAHAPLKLITAVRPQGTQFPCHPAGKSFMATWECIAPARSCTERTTSSVRADKICASKALETHHG